jgi:CRP-like cAMP-binding protein
MENMEAILGEVETFQGMKPAHLKLLADCASEVRYEAGDVLGRVGGDADNFWVIREGRLALQLPAAGRGGVTVATSSKGAVVGFSWLVPPYALQFDVRAVTPTVVIAIDAARLRAQFPGDHELAYDLLSRFTRIMSDRIEAMSMQVLDVFGEHPVDSD